MVAWFAFGLLVGAAMGIVPFMVVARRWNTKVAANSASPNSAMDAIACYCGKKAEVHYCKACHVTYARALLIVSASNSTSSADVRRNAFILEVFMLDKDVKNVKKYLEQNCTFDHVHHAFDRIKTALEKSAPSAIAEACPHWRPGELCAWEGFRGFRQGCDYTVPCKLSKEARCTDQRSNGSKQ